jgi:hypothetical protein
VKTIRTLTSTEFYEWIARSTNDKKFCGKDLVRESSMLGSGESNDTREARRSSMNSIQYFLRDLQILGRALLDVHAIPRILSRLDDLERDIHGASIEVPSSIA